MATLIQVLVYPAGVHQVLQLTPAIQSPGVRVDQEEQALMIISGQVTTVFQALPSQLLKPITPAVVKQHQLG